MCLKLPVVRIPLSLLCCSGAAEELHCVQTQMPARVPSWRLTWLGHPRASTWALLARWGGRGQSHRQVTEPLHQASQLELGGPTLSRKLPSSCTLNGISFPTPAPTHHPRKAGLNLAYRKTLSRVELAKGEGYSGGSELPVAGGDQSGEGPVTLFQSLPVSRLLAPPPRPWPQPP